MTNLIRRALHALGLRLVYVCEWGTYDYRYDDADHHANRPIHRGMSVAPPWAKRRIVRNDHARTSDI